MPRTVNPPRPVVSTDGRADARGSVTVSTATARAVLAALAGLTVHPWPGVEHGEDRTPLTLSAALEGVPATPEAIIAAVDALEAAGNFASGDGEPGYWRPNVGALEAGARYRWMPWGAGEREIVIHFRGDDAVISWRSDVTMYRQVQSDGWTDRRGGGREGRPPEPVYRPHHRVGFAPLGHRRPDAGPQRAGALYLIFPRPRPHPASGGNNEPRGG